MEIQLFNSPQFGQVRTAGTSTDPIFCASDVCRALGYSNGRKAIADHCDEGDVTKCDTPTASGIQSMTFVNESGLFSLIFGSKLDSAKQFKKWVTSEVLPTIRKTGGYCIESLSRKELALMVIQSEEEKEALLLENKRKDEQLEEQKPKVLFADAVTTAKQSCLIGELAKIICQNGYKIGEKRLFAWMRDHNYLGSVGERYNSPNQKYIEMGLFEVKKNTIVNGGCVLVKSTTKVTGKGQLYFINKFLGGK